MITLYSDSRFCSPWVLAVWAAMKEKGIPFETKVFDLEKGESRADADYVRHTLTGKVPALDHDGVWIGESLAILEYLEDVFPSPRMYPESAAERARDRQILSWLRSDLLELRRCMPFEGILLKVATPEITPKAKEETALLLRTVATRISAAHEKPTLADYELAFAMRRPMHYGVDLGGNQEAVSFSEKIWSRPSVQSWVTQARVPFTLPRS